MQTEQAIEQKTKELSNLAAGRELTVGELIDRRIEKADRLMRALIDLKESLPQQYLRSGASRVSAFLEF